MSDPLTPVVGLNGLTEIRDLPSSEIVKYRLLLVVASGDIIHLKFMCFFLFLIECRGKQNILGSTKTLKA